MDINAEMLATLKAVVNPVNTHFIGRGICKGEGRVGAATLEQVRSVIEKVEKTPKPQPKVVLIDLYGDGDVIEPFLAQDGLEAAAREWDAQDKPMNFTSWMTEHGFMPLEHTELRLRNI